MASVRVNVLGDASSLRRAYAAAAEATKAFGRNAAETSTHVEALNSHLGGVHDSLKSFAKTALYTGGALVGVGSLYEGIKKTVEVVEEFNVAQRQLETQLRANGESVKAVVPWVEKLQKSQEKLGFNSTETADAFTKLDRASGSAAVAYKYMGVTADLAAARHINLSLAAQLVGKIIQGNTAALNRYGIIIPKTDTAVEALAYVHHKLAGQAAASVTPFKVFGAVLHDIERQIGAQLLPVINKYMNKINDWLEQTRNQKKIIDTVKTALHDMGVVVGTVHTMFEKMLPTLKTLASDGFAGIRVAINLAKGAFDLLAAAFGKHKTAMIAGIAAIGVAITLAIGPEAAAITGALLAVGYIKKHWSTLTTYFLALGIEIRKALSTAWVAMERGAIEAALKIVEPFSHLPGSLGGWARKAKDDMQAELDKLHMPNMNWKDSMQKAALLNGTAYVDEWQKVMASIGVTNPKLQVGTAAPKGYQPGSYGQAPSSPQNPGGFLPTGPAPGGATGGLSAGRSKMLAFAKSAIGTPYVWGGSGPGGFDCSGLVEWAFANGLNISLPRTTYGQVNTGRLVGSNTLKGAKPGDVIFTQYGEGGKAGPGHEGIYIGGGQVLSAPHTGARVGITSLAGFTGGGRYTVRDLAPGTAVAGAGVPASTVGPPGSTALPGDVLAAQKAAAKAAVAAEKAAKKAGAKAARDKAAADKKALTAFKTEETYQFKLGAIIMFDDQKAAAKKLAGFQAGETASFKLGALNMFADQKATAKKLAGFASDETRSFKVGAITMFDSQKATEKKRAAFQASEASQFKLQASGILADSSRHGLKLLSPGLQTAIGLQGGLSSTSLGILEKARKELTALQKTLTGHIEPLPIAQELGTVEKAINKINFRKSENAWKNHIKQLKAISTQATDSFKTAFGNLASAALNEFDRQTQQGLNSIAAAGAQLTPSEQALQNLQDAHDQAAAQAQLAADQAAGDQNAVQEDLYQMQVAALQKQANAERAAQDADTSARQQSYQDQRDVDRSAFQQQLSDLQTQLATKHTTIADANAAILALMSKFGLDPTWFAAGADAGNALITALATALAAGQETLNQANSANDALTRLQQAGPGGGGGGGGGGTPTDANSTGGYGIPATGVSPGNAPAVAAKKALKKGGGTPTDANSTGYGYGIPGMATGGFVTRTGIALVHRGETVVPAGRGGGNTLNFSFPNYVGSKKELTDTVIAELRRANRQGSIRDFNFA